MVEMKNLAHGVIVKHKDGTMNIYKNGLLEKTIEKDEECTIQAWYWDVPSVQIRHCKDGAE